VRRRLLNFVTALSLLLCVTAVVLWVRNWSSPGPAGEPAGWRGTLQLKALTTRPADQPAQVGDLVGYAIDDLEGPGIVTERVQRVGGDGIISLPYRWRMRVVGVTAADIDSAISEEYRHVHDYYNDRFRVTVGTGDWRVSYVLLVLILGVPPAARLLTGVSAIVRWHQKRRVVAGLCPACDYDLTGNVSGVCPECGKEVVRR
jgi:hypothetical protein